jgi:hypothetical protein
MTVYHIWNHLLHELSTVLHCKITTKKLMKHYALGTGSIRSVLEKIDLERQPQSPHQLTFPIL